jgi:hypothetical protein
MARDPGGHFIFGIIAALFFVAAAILHLTGISLSPLHYVPIFHRPAQKHAAAFVPPAHYYWLSREFSPGDPALIDVVGAGDVMMGSRDQRLDPDIDAANDVSELVGEAITAIFHRADVAFVNLEGPLYDGDDPPAKVCAHCYVFRSPTSYARLLAQLGVSAVSLANNHSGDYGDAGRAATIAALQDNHIGYFGLDRDDARIAERALRSGDRAAIVSFAPNTGTLDINDLAAETRLIRALKASHRIVVVSFHGGGEGEEYEHVAAGHVFFDGEDRGDVVAFAHDAIDAGADIVIGQGPHVPRALEIYRGHLIAYSLGNFWTYGAIGTSAARGAGPVLEAWLAPDGLLAGFAIHSTEQREMGVPRLDPDGDAERRILALTRADFPETGARLEKAQRGPKRTAESRTSVGR